MLRRHATEENMLERSPVGRTTLQKGNVYTYQKIYFDLTGMAHNDINKQIRFGPFIKGGSGHFGCIFLYVKVFPLCKVGVITSYLHSETVRTLRSGPESVE